TGFTDELEHPVIAREDLGVEDANAARRGGFGKMRQEDRSEAPPLIGIGDGEGDLGAITMRGDVDPLADDVGGRPRGGDQAKRAAVESSEAPGRFGEKMLPAAAEEAEPAGPVKQTAKEGTQGQLIVRPHGPDVERRPVTKHDV